MAKYNFDVSGSQLIISLVPVLDDVQPTSMSYLAPSFKIGVGKINAYEYGQPKQSFLFTEIGEIDGEAPTDLQDAFDKLTTATANFNGGGAAPYKVYTALLTQSGTDAPVATVLENTLGEDVTFSYDTAGVYLINFNQIFPTIEKIYFNIGNSFTNNGNFYSVEKGVDVSTLYTTVADTGTNGLLLYTEIEIRVYN